MIRQGKAPATTDSRPVVVVVDDDPGMRSALMRLLESNGLCAEAYASGPAMLATARLDRPGCMLLDVRMPEMDGLEVQAELNRRRVELPTIFLTGSADVPVAVAAMQAGAADFIEKPFESELLLARVRQVIERYAHRLAESAERREVSRRLGRLTPRESEVMELVVTGLTSKEIARKLGTSPRTVEIHRTHVMEKMAAATLADLVRMRLQQQVSSGAP
ncbi:MAG: response regulator transcription factor [Pseudomarimonas sp.]